MANVIKNFLGYLKLNEDDDYDDFEAEFQESESRRQAREEKEIQKQVKEEEAASRRTNRAQTARVMDEREVPISELRNKDKGGRQLGNTSNKIVPIRTTTKGLEVCIMKPSSFEDSQDICDMLLSGRASVVNLEGFDPLDAQRIMDFISGCVYAINGKLHQISKYIFIFSPDSIDISGDYLEFMPDEGFEVPTLNKDF